MTMSLQAVSAARTWGGAPKISDELEGLSSRIIESVVLVRGNRNGMGSGVVWNADGLIITNHHVATNESAKVQFNNGKTFDAKVIARDVRRDLAALQIEGKTDARPAEIGDSSALKTGQLVLAVGNPQGERNAVTLGIVSSIGDNGWLRGSDKILQLSLTLRPGNSGGALADLSGKVVGIPNMVMRNGLSLAVPSDAVQRFLQGEQGGRLGVGIRWVKLPSEVKEKFSTEAGLLLLEVEANGPAHQGGLMVGDVIIAVESQGKQLPPQSIVERELTAGQTATLQILRGGAIISTQITPTKG